jgi:hypothetical protein
MDTFFQIDFKKLVQLLLAVKLRRRRLSAFLYAMIAPMETLHSIFVKSRAYSFYRLSITPQVCYLEKFLNDRYDVAKRRIRITNAAHADTVYLYLRAENKPLYLFTQAENRPVYLFTREEISNSAGADFIITVPAAVTFNENQMCGEIDSYKLAGKKYQIITV